MDMRKLVAIGVMSNNIVRPMTRSLGFNWLNCTAIRELTGVLAPDNKIYGVEVGCFARGRVEQEVELA